MMGRSFLKRFVCGVVLAVFCAGSLTGCASMRKKFKRVPKNPKVKQEFIPVLQPVEYAKIEQTPQQVYAGHYSMVRIYFKDLWEALGARDSGPKREKYIFTELTVHFDAMAAFLSDEKKTEARGIRSRVANVLKAYDKPDGLRRYDLMRDEMRRVERDIYKGFKPDAVARAFAVPAP